MRWDPKGRRGRGLHQGYGYSLKRTRRRGGLAGGGGLDCTRSIMSGRRRKSKQSGRDNSSGPAMGMAMLYVGRAYGAA